MSEATPTLESGQLRCRFYRRQFPEIDSLVMAQILNVTDLGAACSLLEYDNIEGFIASSDFSRKRIRSVKKLIRVGKKEVLQVLRVDEERGYVDLSKKLLTAKDIEVCSDLFEQARQVDAVLHRLAEVTSVPLPTLMEKFGWGLYEGEPSANGKVPTAYAVLKRAIKEPESLKPFNVPQELLEPLMKIVTKRLASNPVKVESEISLTCFGIDGVDAIKAGLSAAAALSTEEMPLKVQVKASPVYTLSMVHMEKDICIEFIQNAIEVVRAEISKYPQGALSIKTAPVVV